MGMSTRIATVCRAGGLTLIASVPAQAQDVVPWSRTSADTVVSWRVSDVEGAPFQANLFLDWVGALRLTDRLTVVTRPVAWRSRGDEWHGRVAQLVVRYERPGAVGLRVDGGYLAQPVGLAALEIRADANPTVLPALSFDMSLPAFETGAPRLALPALTYPLGVQASLSGRRWDARVAVVDSSPMRARSPFIDGQPAAAPQAILGGGLAPRPGFRVGGWLASGPYATRDELTGADTDGRQARIGAVETEFSRGHWRLAAEVIAARLETTLGARTAVAWMAEGVHAVTPRWFAGGRLRSLEGPTRPASGRPGPMQRLLVGELTAGYRLSPDVTLRASALARQPYGRDAVSLGAATSVVWARRWF
jgi:hypothetical protein